MNKNNTKPTVKTYLLHWFDYIYLRITHWYTPKEDECPDLSFGPLFIGAIFMPFLILVSEKLNWGLVDIIYDHKVIGSIIFAIICYSIFPKKMYYRARELFGEESHKTRKILGIMVVLTIVVPYVIMAVIVRLSIL